MEDSIKLYFKDKLLGELSYSNHEYCFIINNKLDDKNLLDITGFTLSTSKSKTLFYIFKRFIPEKSRTDIIRMANINEKDDQFTILNKVSMLNLNKDQFWIGR